MKTVIENATIITMRNQQDIFTGDLCINGSEIEYIGPKAPQSCYPATVMDGTGFAVLPSFVNAHTHLAMTLMRNYKDQESNLQDWLQQIWAIEDKLTDKDIRLGSDLGCAELIRSGITAFEDMYFSIWETAESALDAGIRANLGFTFFGDLNETKRRFRELLPKIEDYAGAEDLIQIDFAPHAIYTVTGDSYSYIADAALERNWRVHTHLSETRFEVENCLKDHGCSPVFYLEKLGVLKADTVLAHCVHLTDDELPVLKSCGASLVHCPSSNSKLASGIMNSKKLKNAGLNLALGTDGASSNNNLNMMKEMNLAAMLASATTGDTQALTPFEVLSMATKNGAKALGLADKIGTLEAGKKADLIMVDLKGVNNTPVNNVLSALVYSSTSEDIKNVFCNGEMLMKNRRLLTIDEKKTTRKALKTWNELLAR